MADLEVLSTAADQVVVQASFPTLNTEQLFEYWVRPDLVTKWWPPQAEVLDGGYLFSWPQMNWRLRGEYLEYAPGESLEFTWRWEHEPDRPVRTVQVDFRLIDPHGSEMILTHSTYNDSAEDQEERQGHIEGWIHFLGQLQKIANDGTA